MIRIFKFMLAVWFMALAFNSLSIPWPIVWITLYGLLSVVCILAVFEFYRMWALIAIGLVILIAMASQFDGFNYWLETANKLELLGTVEEPEILLKVQARNFFSLLSGLITILLLLVFQATHRQPS